MSNYLQALQQRLEPVIDQHPLETRAYLRSLKCEEGARALLCADDESAALAPGSAWSFMTALIVKNLLANDLLLMNGECLQCSPLFESMIHARQAMTVVEERAELCNLEPAIVMAALLSNQKLVTGIALCQLIVAN